MGSQDTALRRYRVPGTAALLKEKNVTVPRLTRIIRSGLDESGADANGAEISLSSFVPPRLPVSVCKTINVHKRTPDCKNGHNPWLSPTFIIKDQGRRVGKQGTGTGKKAWSYGRRVGAPGRRVGESTVRG